MQQPNEIKLEETSEETPVERNGKDIEKQRRHSHSPKTPDFWTEYAGKMLDDEDKTPTHCLKT